MVSINNEDTNLSDQYSNDLLLNDLRSTTTTANMSSKFVLLMIDYDHGFIINDSIDVFNVFQMDYLLSRRFFSFITSQC